MKSLLKIVEVKSTTSSNGNVSNHLVTFYFNGELKKDTFTQVYSQGLGLKTIILNSLLGSN